MRVVTAIIGALLGMVVTYMIGAAIACDLIWRGSNLCGLPSVFVAAPLGLIAGAILGWRFGARRAGSRPSP